MTTISIALNGPRQRDISLYSGDDASLAVIIYAKDGDKIPVAVSNLSVVYSPGPNGWNTVLNRSVFQSHFYWRTQYTMTGVVNGARTTLAYGLISSPNYIEPTVGFCDYGWWVWGYEPPIIPNGNWTYDNKDVTFDGLVIAYQ